jgi:hypothetical protein
MNTTTHYREVANVEQNYSRPIPVKLSCIIVALVGLGMSEPAQSKATPRIAKQCRSMALAAHPKSLPDEPAVANLRRGYYNLCIARRGKMDPYAYGPVQQNSPGVKNKSGDSYERAIERYYGGCPTGVQTKSGFKCGI